MNGSPKDEATELLNAVVPFARDATLATPSERRVSVPPEMELLMELDEWHHPDLIEGDVPSASRTFQQLARVLETGDVRHYEPSEPPNTHWSNWPEGGTL